MKKKNIKKVLDILTADNDKVTCSINGIKIKIPINATNEEIAKTIYETVNNTNIDKGKERLRK